jgi:plastocyanin
MSTTTATGRATPTAGAGGINLEVLDFTLQPLTVTVAGSDVQLDVTNSGPTVHNVTIRDDAGMILGATRDLRTGEAETLEAGVPPGTYVLFCSLPGHESLGIKGTLTVTAP